MSGNVKQFVDFSSNTNNDTGENTTTSIQPILNGNPVDATNLSRPSESLRQRTEAVKNVQGDTLYLRDADRNLLVSGPGLITWPGSTTAGFSGVPTLSDTLYIIPMLTPGFAQTAPVPPVASSYGTLHLKRADTLNSILVTSQRRSYAAGDQISIDVTTGLAFSCTLDTDSPYQRTIHIVAVSGVTQLSTVITALNALTPLAPDNTQLVTAALEGGALGTDILLTPQAKQFVSGNYDGEGHAITPANLQAFFTANPTSALAEGDSLCVQYAMVSDTASTGGRRQAIPENANTAIALGAFFNSRVNPEKIVNSIPICKVINGSLVFSTGVEIAAGEILTSLSSVNTQSPIIRNGDFEHGVTANTGRFGVSDWENRLDLAVNGNFQLTATSPIAGGKSLAFVNTAVTAATARIEQEQELEVSPTQNVTVSIKIKQLIAPTAGTISLVLYWGDLDSTTVTSTTVVLQVLSATDATPRLVQQTVAVPSNKRFLKMVTVEVAGVTAASTGTLALFDALQVWIENPTVVTIAAANNGHMKPQTVDAVIIEDPNTYSVGQLAALLRFDRTSPASEGSLYGERKDQVYDSSHSPPALAWYGRIQQLGAKLLATSSDARSKARISTPFLQTGDLTLIWESKPLSGSEPTARMYVSLDGDIYMTQNAFFDGTNFNKDTAGTIAMQWSIRRGHFDQHAMVADAPWSIWTQISQMNVNQVQTVVNQSFKPFLELFDANGNRRMGIDHMGFPPGLISDLSQEWRLVPMSSITAGTNYDGWIFQKSGSGNNYRAVFNANSPMGYYGIESTLTAGTAGTTAIFQYGFVPVIGAGPGGLAWPASNVSVMMEWETAGVFITGVNPGVTIFQGFSADGFEGVYFLKENGNANWKFVTCAFGPQNKIDTGIPVVGGTTRMRIEVYGSNYPGGNVAYGYINGVLVAATSTSLPVQDEGAVFQLYGTAVGNAVVDISPVRYFYSRWHNHDSL